MDHGQVEFTRHTVGTSSRATKSWHHLVSQIKSMVSQIDQSSSRRASVEEVELAGFSEMQAMVATTLLFLFSAGTGKCCCSPDVETPGHGEESQGHDMFTASAMTRNSHDGGWQGCIRMGMQVTR
jgi:hypothetical protein